MEDETREYSIIIWPIESQNGSILVNLYATSVSGRPQIHGKSLGVNWADAIDEFKRLPIDESYDVDSIQGLLSQTPCDLHVRCTMRELEAIGFIYP